MLPSAVTASTRRQGCRLDDALMMEAVHQLTILHQSAQRAVCGKMDRVQMVLLVMQDIKLCFQRASMIQLDHLPCPGRCPAPAFWP